MIKKYEPAINEWYREIIEDRVFKVVAIDEAAETIEIQYFESEIEELDFDTWYEMELELAAEPEDWTGPYDDLVRDDMGDTESPMHPENWSGPIGDIE